TFSQQQELTASDGTALDQFGFSVAMTGDTAVVGTVGADNLPNNEQGAAYVFVRSGTSWSQQAKLLASDGASGDVFGWSVAISGNASGISVVVGAPWADIGSNTFQGAAYVFTRATGGATWSEQQKLVAPDGAASDFFGYSVAITGDRVFVGAPEDDVGSNTDQGSVNIFARSNSMWSWIQLLTANDGAASDQFGSKVAVDNSSLRLLVGAPADDVGSNTDQGSAYVFRPLTPSNFSWTQQQKLVASDGAAGDLFGSSVAIHVSTLVVGADHDDIGSNSDQGSAYVFALGGSTWSEQQKLTASDGAASDKFGWSVAISSNFNWTFVVVGAPFDDIGSRGDQGSAYVFTRNFNSATWNQFQKLTAANVGGSGDPDYFGWSVAVPPVSAQHLVVGSPVRDVGANRFQGSAYVFALN